MVVPRPGRGCFPASLALSRTQMVLRYDTSLTLRTACCGGGKWPLSPVARRRRAPCVPSAPTYLNRRVPENLVLDLGRHRDAEPLDEAHGLAAAAGGEGEEHLFRGAALGPAEVPVGGEQARRGTGVVHRLADEPARPELYLCQAQHTATARPGDGGRADREKPHAATSLPSAPPPAPVLFVFLFACRRLRFLPPFHAPPCGPC